MKINKIIFAIGIILCLAIVGLGVYGFFISDDKKEEEKGSDSTLTLKQIVEKFESSETSKWYINPALPFSTSIEDKTLIIKANEKEYKYNLEGSILSIKLPNEDIDGMMLTFALIDSIEQLHGYQEGEIFSILNSEQIREYTINEGVQRTDDIDDINIKVDINKKLEIIDFAKLYFETKDLTDIEEFLNGTGCIYKIRGNVTINKCGNEEEKYITVGEKGNITDNTYKSLLSMIEIMYGTEEKGKFASAFPILENKSFGQYTLTINPSLDELLSMIFSDPSYKIVQLKIEK